LFFDISILFYKGTIVNTEIRVILFDKCFYYSGCKFGFPLLPRGSFGR
jgi:hypothetical protein